MAYDFHYTPTGTGVISGKEVLEQTEDAINDLGNTAISGVQEALDKAEQALTNSENAVDDAQTALNTANNAEGVAIQAQTDVGNLSGTVTNIGNRITTAEGNITNLQGRMTTAEGNITNLQGRMTTAETNIGNLQTAVSTAQATANSAQQTATTARQQSYVFRYSGTAVVPNSTIAYSTIDNTDNIKSGDKILDVDGKLFEITAVDTTNQTVTVGSALIDLALDGNVVHTSGDETVGGQKTFSDDLSIYNSDNSVDTPVLNIKTSKYVKGDTTDTDTMRINFLDSNGNNVASIYANKNTSGTQYLSFQVYTTDNNNANITSTINYYISKNGDKYFVPYEDGQISLGSSVRRWKSVYATNYYYGSNNVEFSTKFVTSDTDQSVSGQKVFSDINVISSSAEIGVSSGNNSFKIFDKNKKTISRYEGGTFSSGMAYSYLLVNNGSDVFNGVTLYQSSSSLAQLRPYSSTLSLQLGASNRYFSDCYTSKINGLEPSSLGMPVAPSSTSYVDISGYITVLDSSSANTYTPPSNGYITFSVTGALVQIFHDYGLQGKWTVQAGNANRGFIPVLGGVKVKIYVTASNIDKFWFIPCQGNI